jgi:hypothetical protein
MRCLSIVLLSLMFLSGCAVAPANTPTIAPANVSTPTKAPAFVAAPTSDNKVIYRDYFGSFYGWDNVNSYAIRADQPNKYNAFLADLTQDGAYELIVTDDTFGDSVELTVYTVMQGEAVMIHGDISTYEPRAKTFGIYLKDDKAYMLICENNMTQTGGDCSYRVFSLTSTGEENVLIQDTYAEQFDPETGEVGDAYYDFLARQDNVLQQSTILFRSEDGFVLQSSPEALLN